MKKFLFTMISLLAVACVYGQRIQTGDKWWDGSVHHTANVDSNGNAELNGVDMNGDHFRIVLMSSSKSGEYSVFSREGAIALRISEMAKVRYVRQNGMNFLAYYNRKGDVAWTMVLTPDDLQDCIGQEKWAEMQPVSNLLRSMLMNTTYLARFSKPDLRLMRNEILARHGWKFQSKDLRDYFGRQSWYKPGTNNDAIKLSVIEQTNLELLKSEESTPEEYRTSMLNAANYPGGLADDGRGPDEIDGEREITVTNEREFLAALGPNRTVVIAKDVHLNLSRVLENENLFKNIPHRRWSSVASDFIGGEPLTVSESETDGRQLALVNMSGLVIRGTYNSSIEVDPRYSYCIYFINCDHCEVQNLTIGHTEYGHCSGGVIGVRGGSYNVVKDCDLYGCGTYGFDLMQTQDFTALRTKVRDCTYGIMEIINSTAVMFKSCDFLRNKEYTLIESSGSEGVVFDDCRFYANSGDSPLFSFDRLFYLMNCKVYHPTENLGTMDYAVEQGSKNFYSPNPFDVNIQKRNIGPNENN